MEVLDRVPMCDITTFIARLPGEIEQFQGKMSRRSTRNIGKKVDYTFKEIKDSKEDDIKKEATNMSENEGFDSEDNSPKFKLRKRLKNDVKEESASESDSEDEPVKRKDKFSRVEDSGDEDYNPDKDGDDDYSNSGHKTKKSKEIEKPKTKRILTEYEQMVERNRAEKMAFLKSLQFDEVKESLSEAVQSLKEKHKPLRKKRIWAPKTYSGPVRKSLRVLGKHPGQDYSEEALVARMEAVQNEEIQKKLPEILPFKDALKETYSYEDFSKEYSNLDHKTTEPFNEHVSHFQTMQLPESQIAKVVGARITSMAFHPMKENILLAASSKYGQIGFWKVNSGQDSFVFVPHTEGITNLRFNPKLPQFIVSSSYDGTLRCGDFEKAVFNEVHNVSEETCCTFFDFLSHSTFLVGQKDGIVSVVDHRAKPAACKKHQCHNDSVKSVSVHPVDNSYFVTAGNKGAIKLWDLRKLQKQPIVEVQHHKRCVQSAYFSPLTGKHVLTTSNDDSICLFDSSNLGKSLLLKHSLKHTYRRSSNSTWLPNTDNAFVVGSVSQKVIEIYNDKMENIFNLAHENLYCQTVTNVFHPSLPVMAGSATVSGKVFVFSSGGVK